MPTVKFKVLQINIGQGGRLDDIIDLVRHTGADICGFQELRRPEAEIAEALGYNFLDQGCGQGIASKFPILGTTPECGAVIKIQDGAKIVFNNHHFFYKPYGPYQVHGIEYCGYPFVSTAEEAIAEALKARGEDVAQFIRELARAGTMPVIATVDLNEPSHRDWTIAAALLGRHRTAVEWPATKAFENARLVDAYREIFPDEISHPGFTWTTSKSQDDPSEHHDRIDLVFYRGGGLRAVAAYIVGEDSRWADIVFSPYSSDHRAVLIEFERTY